MKRKEVYEIIDSEREYQIERHINHPIPHRDEDHSIADWLIYMREHLDRAHIKIYDLNFAEALDEIRKVTALGVACMEFKGGRRRRMYGI